MIDTKKNIITINNKTHQISVFNKESIIYKYLTEKDKQMLNNNSNYNIKKRINNLRKDYMNINDIITFEKYSLNWIEIINNNLIKYNDYIPNKIKYDLFIDCKLPNNNNNLIRKENLIPIKYNSVNKYVSYYEIESDSICIIPLTLIKYFAIIVPNYVKNLKLIINESNNNFY